MKNMVTFTVKCQKWTIFSLSTVMIILGIFIVAFSSDVFQKILKHELSLANSKTQGYAMWKETPIPMYLEFYLFNWTNFKEFKENPSLRPSFQECGPYTYYEHHVRENVTFNGNDTITFLTKRTWKFLPEKSNGSLQDNITTLNPIVATVGNLVKDKHYLVRRGVNFFFKDKKIELAATKTVDEFLFEGYEDPLLDLVKKLNISGVNVPYDRFGWFVGRNESAEYDGVYNINTGADDIEKLGILNTWNYVDKISYLSGDCAKVKGTTGELWYPPKKRNSVELFSSDLCSSVQLFKNGDHTIYGVEGHKYVGTDSVFDNGTRYPEMKCFVPDGVTQPSGVRNVSLCKFGAPAFVSYAHFYLADASYRKVIVGMNPNKEKHQLFLALEPSTGLPLRVQASLQINLKMERIEGIDMLSNVTTIIMPAFWFSQKAEITKDLTSQAKILLILPSALQYTGCGILFLGILILLIGGLITFREGWKICEEEQLLNQQSL